MRRFIPVFLLAIILFDCVISAPADARGGFMNSLGYQRRLRESRQQLGHPNHYTVRKHHWHRW